MVKNSEFQRMKSMFGSILKFIFDTSYISTEKNPRNYILYNKKINSNCNFYMCFIITFELKYLKFLIHSSQLLECMTIATLSVFVCS